MRTDRDGRDWIGSQPEVAGFESLSLPAKWPSEETPARFMSREHFGTCALNRRHVRRLQFLEKDKSCPRSSSSGYPPELWRAGRCGSQKIRGQLIQVGSDQWSPVYWCLAARNGAMGYERR